MYLQILTKTTFFCDFGYMRKNSAFCHELANTRPTKELKAFFALAESLPTSAALLEGKQKFYVPLYREAIKS